jgi:Copper transport outer membrane protein, MctB
MGYSSRYHVASLAAVFIALAVGILIGAALGSDVITGTAENLEADLSEDLDRVRGENADLREELEFERGFSADIVPALLSGRLAGREVALIGLGNVDTAALSTDVEGALAPADAELTEVASVREPPDAATLTDSLLTDRHRRELATSDQLRLAGERAGRLLAGGGELPSDLRATLLSEFSGDPESLDAAIVVRTRPDDLNPREESDTEAFEEGVIDGLRAAGLRVAGAEREDADPSSIEFLASQGVATVDNVDQLAGKVALVLVLNGADGDFGVKDTADSLLPNLIDPASSGAGG